MSSAVETKKETEKILMVFAGARIGNKDQRLQLWIPISDEELEVGKLKDPDWEKNARAYKGLNVKGRPGTVFRFDQDVGTTTVQSSGEFVGEWKGKDVRAQWDAQHDYNLAKLNKIAQQKKASMRNVLYELLDPLREVYRKVPHSQRTLFLMRVAEYLARGEKS